MQKLNASHIPVSIFPSALLLLTALAQPAWADSFDFNSVTDIARKLAAKPYQEPDRRLPPSIADLNYDQYRDIRYKPDHNIWRSQHLPFEMAFFHRGHFFLERVEMNEIDASGVHPLPYDPDNFSFGSNKVEREQLHDLGFAGMRVHYPVNSPDYKDEVLVFLGGSYFRALGRNQHYGTSARGLAIDTGQSSGEEFPRFSRLWVVKPAPDAKTLTIYALLESPRAVGAYHFVLTPGEDTTLTINAQLFLRDHVATLGVAPLTSMFLFGGNQHPSGDDYRPEVHDADGLSLHSGNGEWLWRPLVNPGRLLISSFSDRNPAGFGLMQRQRAGDHYEDIEANYESRPSVWVEPLEPWGEGRVELVEIPTPDETHDNIVAYWVPAKLPDNQPYHFSYRLHWQRDNATRPPQSWVVQTRRGHSYQEHPDDSIYLMVDFDGPALAALPKDSLPKATISVDNNAQLLENTSYRNPIDGGVRVNLRLRRLDANRPVELRAFLKNGETTVSETWSYLLPPG